MSILIPAFASSSPTFFMMYSAYMLNNQGDNIQPWRTPFHIWNQSVVQCPVLTITSWPAYRFPKRQVRWCAFPISLRIFQSFVVGYTVKVIQGILAIWSLVLLPFLNPTWTSGSSWFTECWSLACKILSISLLVWEMSAIVWWLAHSLVLPFLGIGMRIDLFQLWPLLGLPDLLTYWMQHVDGIIL